MAKARRTETGVDTESMLPAFGHHHFCLHSKTKGKQQIEGEPMTDHVETKYDLTNRINEMFKRCEKEGMVFPLIMCTISPNGSVFASRMDSIGCAKILVQHSEPDGFKVPLSLVLVDQNNAVARITIDHTGNIVHHVHHLSDLRFQANSGRPGCSGPRTRALHRPQPSQVEDQSRTARPKRLARRSRARPHGSLEIVQSQTKALEFPPGP